MSKTTAAYPSGPKSTWLEQAHAIASGLTPVDTGDIPALLAWLRDCNWPGALIIAQFLPRFGDRLVAPVREILRSHDLMWSYWVCSCLLDKCAPSTCRALAEDLKQLAYANDPEGAHLAALRLVAKHRFDAPERIVAAISKKSADDPANEAEYRQLSVLLNHPLNLAE